MLRLVAWPDDDTDAGYDEKEVGEDNLGAGTAVQVTPRLFEVWNFHPQSLQDREGEAKVYVQVEEVIAVARDGPFRWHELPADHTVVTASRGQNDDVDVDIPPQSSAAPSMCRKPPSQVHRSAATWSTDADGN